MNKFERGQNIKKSLSLGMEFNSVLITRIQAYKHPASSLDNSYVKEILNDLTNPEYRDYYLFYRVPGQEEIPHIPKDFEMETQIKFLPNTKETVFMLFDGEYYDVPRNRS